MPSNERKKEIKRRRQRKKKMAILARKAEKGSSGDKIAVAEKLRALTPGAEVIVKNWGLE